MSIESTLTYLGLSRPCVKILAYLLNNSGYHDTLALTRSVGLAQPVISLCSRKLSHFISSEEIPVPGQRKKISFAALPRAEIKEKLLFIIEEREKELAKHKTFLEGL